MNKSELVAKIAADADLKKGDAEKFLDAFVATVKEVIAAGDKIQLVGFGTFEAKERGAREGVNPKKKKKISIPACKVPSFKPGKGLKEELNK